MTDNRIIDVIEFPPPGEPWTPELIARVVEALGGREQVNRVLRDLAQRALQADRPELDETA